MTAVVSWVLTVAVLACCIGALQWVLNRLVGHYNKRLWAKRFPGTPYPKDGVPVGFDPLEAHRLDVKGTGGCDVYFAVWEGPGQVYRRVQSRKRRGFTRWPIASDSKRRPLWQYPITWLLWPIGWLDWHFRLGPRERRGDS